MHILSEREKALEEQYFVDAERSFKLCVRRDRLFAMWVANLLGHDDFAAYADEITEARLRGAGDEEIISKALSDLRAAGKSIGEGEVTAKMRELMAEAVTQLAAESAS
ncbi:MULTISPECIES: ATPase inhibitor subunit zeta [unclassified Sinorhizobium]|uniref:ATPase inhibitor subunit zeta n=1 Tax=unclassified Sinorhizobium TaxID=2613772 RepID=UPI0035239BC1